MDINSLLNEMKKELGEEPVVMQELAKLNPEAVMNHAMQKKNAFMEGVIPPEYKILMSIAISAALRSDNCTITYAKLAKQKGISNEEIMESILFAKFIAGSTVVSSAKDLMIWMNKGKEIL